ncbi:MAG: hypothetical protein UT90_C0004G0010 [Parcubacteria group bacterium GW2011_GWA1_40_21]|nr:MAG: hypothetical protein UT90_C0004G0010 [Parcubacteria group bacterium GW2011_GWA1_40_21]
MNFLKKVGKVAVWFFIVIFVAFVILVIVRMFHFANLKKTAAMVEKIHATKLSLDDVMGKNLPPDPGAEADKTVAGIDANQNGIRDDVELAIFKEYPNSAKTRAVLLQYALALQMEAVQMVVNGGTVTEVATEQSRADTCLADTLVPRKTPESSREYSDIEKIDIFINFLEDKQFNIEIRKEAHKDFYKGNLGSYGESTNKTCDIDYANITN